MKKQVRSPDSQPVLRSAQPQSKLITKPLLLVLLSLGAVLIIFMRIPTRFEARDFILDASWFIELENQFRMGHLLGRDVQFTYGPLAQVLAWLASFVRANDSALYGYAIGNAFFEVVAVVALALSLGMIKQVREAGVIFIFGLYFLLSITLFLRPLILLLSMVLLIRTIEAPLPRRRYMSLIGGLLWFAGQLVTVELGVYAILAAAGFLGLCAILALPKLRRWEIQRQLLPAWSYIEIMIISLGTIVLCNIGVEIFYRFSAPTYIDFDYMRFSLLFIRNYSYTMGLDWQIGRVGTLVLLLSALYTIFTIFIHIRKADKSIFYVLTGLLFTSIVSLKSAFVRSDYAHVFQSAGPFIFLFLLAIYLCANKTLLRYSGYALLLLFSVLSIFYIRNISLTTKQSISDGINIYYQWRNIHETEVDIPSIIPPALRAAVDPHKALLDFPSDNFMAIAMNQQSLAPILQTYAAFNEYSQNIYINDIDIYRNDTEIIYGMDRPGSYQIGHVQSITRSPIIFKYIFENFKLKLDTVFRDEYVVLTPKQQPQPISTIILPYDIQADGNDVNMLLRQPASCGLLQMDITLHYPITAMLGRPNQLTLVAYNGEQMLVKNDLVAIENGQTFSTFFYIGPNERFYRIFSATASPDINVLFNRIRIMPRPHDLLGVNPDKVVIANLRCVQQHTP